MWSNYDTCMQSEVWWKTQLKEKLLKIHVQVSQIYSMAYCEY